MVMQGGLLFVNYLVFSWGILLGCMVVSFDQYVACTRRLFDRTHMILCSLGCEQDTRHRRERVLVRAEGEGGKN